MCCRRTDALHGAAAAGSLALWKTPGEQHALLPTHLPRRKRARVGSPGSDAYAYVETPRRLQGGRSLVATGGVPGFFTRALGVYVMVFVTTRRCDHPHWLPKAPSPIPIHADTCAQAAGALGKRSSAASETDDPSKAQEGQPVGGRMENLMLN